VTIPNRTNKTTRALAAFALALLMPAFGAGPAGAEAPITANQLVEMAIQANPQVKSARYRLQSAEHSIKQTVAPNDPIFTYTNSDSVKSPVGRASLRQFNFTESFQFPGKAFFQRDQALRTAEIARLTVAAAIRDLRAAVLTGYYQLLLDTATAEVNRDNNASLEQVLKVTQIAYSASQVTQTDVISAEFDLTAGRQLQKQYETAIANDQTTLDQLLFRPPGEHLNVDRTLKLEALTVPLDPLIDRAYAARQEILEAALTERNFNTALSLAKMEYLPDFTAGVQYDQYLVPSFAPTNSQPNDWVGIIGFNLPIFFWIKQNEDVARARTDLAAARTDLASLRSQTAATVATLYRTTQFAYDNATVYRDTLTPLAGEDFRVALIAYQGGKIDFVTLSGALQRSYAARISYLQAANQFLAGEVSLEQAIGAPLVK
jgi:outer membrane protein, heavy metal efflux system